MLGTALTESQARYLHQVGTGPALGLWQMEPATHDDIWQNFLHYEPDLLLKMRQLTFPGSEEYQNLQSNLLYGAGMCRLHYRRVKASIPSDAEGMAAYWKRYYNTPQGAGTVERALPHFRVACQD